MIFFDWKSRAWEFFHQMNKQTFVHMKKAFYLCVGKKGKEI